MAEGPADRPAGLNAATAGNATDWAWPSSAARNSAGNRFRGRPPQRPDLGAHECSMAPLDYETDREMLAAALGISD